MTPPPRRRRRWSPRERELVRRFVPTVGAITTKVLLLRLRLPRSAAAVARMAERLGVRPGPHCGGRAR